MLQWWSWIWVQNRTPSHRVSDSCYVTEEFPALNWHSPKITKLWMKLTATKNATFRIFSCIQTQCSRWPARCEFPHFRSIFKHDKQVILKQQTDLYRSKQNNFAVVFCFQRGFGLYCSWLVSLSSTHPSILFDTNFACILFPPDIPTLLATRSTASDIIRL